MDIRDFDTVYLTSWMDELFEPAFLSKKEAELFVEELNRQCKESKPYMGCHWTVKPIDLVTSSFVTEQYCLEEGCYNESDGYFFCGECLAKRQGSS